MDDKRKNTTIEFEFFDGEKVELTLWFYALYQLKAKKKSLYERYNKIMVKMQKGTDAYDELDMITVLYVGYMCADPEEAMSEEDFMYKCGADRNAVAEAFTALVSPKKQ